MPPIVQSSQDKIAFQRNFRFSVAFASMCSDGFLTEKLIEAFVAGTVPIYLGDPSVLDDFSESPLIRLHDEKDFSAAIVHVNELELDHKAYSRIRKQAILANDELPEYAKEERIMAFFETVFGS